MPPSLPLYHFTTLEAFKEIHRTNQIRLSPCNDTENAADETKALALAIQKILSDDVSGGLLTEKYSHKTVDQIIEKLVKHREQSYMCCFYSEQNAAKNNHMWEEYAKNQDGEDGVLIQFDSTQFPRTHLVTGKDSVGESTKRTSAIAMVPMNYGINDDMRECIRISASFSDCSAFAFACDNYKPDSFSAEKEKRLHVYLDDSRDLHGVEHPISDNDTRFVTSSKIDPDTNRHEYLFYDIASSDKTVSAIQTVFWRKEKTYNLLRKIINPKMIALIRAD